MITQGPGLVHSLVSRYVLVVFIFDELQSGTRGWHWLLLVVPRGIMISSPATPRTCFFEQVLMFVNINPAPQSQGESSCSLNFAKRCRSVQLGASRRLGGK